MSNSRRQSTRNTEADPYLSVGKLFVVSNKDEQEELFDVEKEEKEIVRLTKLIEPDYLGTTADTQLTEAHLKAAISESQQDIRSLKKPLEYLENVAADLVEFTGINNRADGNPRTILDDIDQHVRDLIEELRSTECRKELLEEIRQTVHMSNQPSRRRNQTNTEFIDVHLQLVKKLSAQLSKWDSLTLRQKFAQDQAYKNFRQRIWEANGSEGIMPHLKTILPAGEGEAEDSDESSGEELEIAAGSQIYKCPLCLGYLKEPMRSTICNHTFCKACFEGYLEQNRSEDAACPTSGCSKLLNLSLVTFDESLATRIRQLLRRQQLRQDTQDELFDDELAPDQAQLNLNSDDSKPHTSQLNNRQKSSSTQRKRRVIVDD